MALRGLDDARSFLVIAGEGDSEALACADEALTRLEKALARLDETQSAQTAGTCRSPYSALPAIISIHAGAGGLEAEAWAAMLLRMYLRFCRRQELSTEIIDQHEGDGRGIKRASFAIAANDAYGLFKNEAGIHRLSRISPFDSCARRHTSFAAVAVIPDVAETSEFEVAEAEIRIDTFRAGGRGGQHMQKTDSAVRVKHLPTGITVVCRNERSQYQNKKFALRMLKGRLLQLKERETKNAIESAIGPKVAAGFGNEMLVRSYTLSPQRLIRDHRTGIKTARVEDVLDGDLGEILSGALRLIPKP